MQQIRGLIQLIRPANSIVMGLAVLVGVALTGFSNLQLLNLFLGMLTGFTLTAAAMAINDYYDLDIDKVNEPKRPIPRGAVSKNAALLLTLILTVAGLLFAYFTSIFCLLFAFGAWVIMVAYSTVGKRSGLLGNFLVSACVAAPFLYGSLVAVNIISLNTLLFASMAFFSNTGREISKGIVDIEGDSSHSIRTLAVLFGSRRAALVASAFFVAAVALSPLPLVYGIVSFWFIPFVLVTDIGLLWCSLSLLRDFSRANARKTKRVILLLFVFGLLSFIAGMLR
jgi:geranylgeranylglycerol-phosphate geranylgeranyltransferase